VTESVVAAAVALVLAATQLPARAATTTLSVTLGNAGITLSRASVPAGTIAFAIRNTAASARRFTVAGRRTAPIAPRQRATLTVTLPRGGSYALVSSGAGRTTKATLRVFALAIATPTTSPSPTATPSTAGLSTCAHPVATTVTVTMTDGGFLFSQTSVPCGAVTFTTTNAGRLEHSLVLGSAAKPGLNAGETATFTVQLAPGDVHWECGTFGHDDLGEEGTLVVA
jgi:hypothetical protein